MEADEHILEKEQKLFATDSLHYEGQDKNERVNNLFAKRFVIVDNDCYLLPEPKTMFKDCLWKIDELQMLKNELNSVKNRLNNYNLEEWQPHTKSRNSAKDVMTRLKKEIQPEFLTQAWCKFYEIVSSFPLIPVNVINSNNKRFKSIHICEAPGAFITSLNHWLKTNVPNIQWEWIATTLNPYYEGNQLSIMIADDRFIRYTLDHWCFGEDNTGNLMNLKNLDKLVQVSEPHDEIFLVTADGSIDCMDDPGEQENMVAHLHFCETIAALQLLANGGSFVLKIFTIFECHSVCLIYLLSCCFDNINVIKPATSKEGNSETYVVCTNYKGATFITPYLEEFRKQYEHGPKEAMFSKDVIPSAFIKKIIECSEFFKSQQCRVIINNIDSFKSDNAEMLHDMKHIQRMVADKYIKDYNLKRLTSVEIVGKLILEGTSSTNVCKKLIQGSYSERCKKQHLAPWDCLKELFNESSKIKIQMTPKVFVKTKFSKLPEDIQICSGKIFHRICSSRFCSESILKIKNGVDDILISMGRKIQFPSTENINKLKEQILIKVGYKILIFHYTDTYDSHEVILKIYDTLQNLETGENLILIGYSLLTRLSVELLYLISFAFNSLEIKLCNYMGSKITLTHYNYNFKILKHLIVIELASFDAQETRKAILEIIPASFLYECNYYFTVMDVNHWVIKSFVHYVQSTLEEKESDVTSNT